MHRWRNLLKDHFTSMNRENAQLGFHFAHLTRYFTEGALPLAAVAVIIQVSREDLCVLLTKRSSSLRSYAGDVCLPGGMYDTSDHSLVNTALRETKEEVGIDSYDLEYISNLPTLPAGIDKLIAVTPVVFLAKSELTININTSEVETTFWVPLDVFFNENTRMPKSFMHIRKFSTVAFNYDDAETQTTFIIWGFTARVCVTAASVALNKSPHFPFTVLALVNSPGDGGITLAEIVMRWSLNLPSNYNKHDHVQSRL